MANIAFLVGGYSIPINNLSGSGLGFFGSAGFGNSVSVGSFQGTTYITDGNGINQGPAANNVAYITSASGQIDGATILPLQSVPNYQSTLNIQFTNPTPCRLQNSKVFIYDRVNQNNSPSGVTCAVANVIHPGTSQGVGGSGSLAWEFPAGSSYILLSQLYNGVAYSPGASGNGINGGGTIDTQHDYYLNISASPNSIGSKTYFGLLFSSEFL